MTEYVMMEEMLGPKTEDPISVEPMMDHLAARDRISELPWEILDNILGRLPIKNAAATTILSRRWKDKWVDVSKLVFDDYLNETSTMDSRLFSKLVYHVLLSHRGPIEEFRFISHCPERYVSQCNEIDAWISYLSNRDIQELTLHFSSQSGICPISDELFFCEQLRSLCLKNCRVFLPENFSGLRALFSLHLTNTYGLGSRDLSELINASPNLEKLMLENCGFKSLAICNAPSLKYLSFQGDFNEIYLENCPYLIDVTFKMTADAEVERTPGYLLNPKPVLWQEKVQGSSHKLVRPLDWLSRTRRLVMSGLFLKFLAKMGNWCGAGIDCDNLEVLELDTFHFDDSDEMTVALSIIRCSSNLNTLVINGIVATDGNSSRFLVWCCSNKLRTVRITMTRIHYDIPEGCISYRYQLLPADQDRCFPDILGLILAGSATLENMHVHYINMETTDLWFMRKLLLYKTLSPQLKLTFNSTRLF